MIKIMEKVLHFLKEFPASILLTFVFMAVLWTYVHTGLPFLERIVDTVLGGLLTAVIGALRKGNTNVTADTVTTDTINNETMPTENVNVNSPEPDLTGK